MKNVLIASVVGLVATAAMADTTITKKPDIGDWWNPLSPNGTYVYSDSFIAPAGDTVVSALGMWLNSGGQNGPTVRFEVWGDTGGFGPDAGNVLSSTGSVGGFNTDGLQYFEFGASAANLVPGQLYWFSATCVGEKGDSAYNVGGHTQNSQYNDNGTFWYSNDPAGVVFDGQGLTPEMAFSVTLTPAPGAAALLGLGGLLAARRRR